MRCVIPWHLPFYLAAPVPCSLTCVLLCCASSRNHGHTELCEDSSAPLSPLTMGKRQARMLKRSLSVCPLAETKLQKKLLLNQKGDKDRNQHQQFSRGPPGAFLLCMVSLLIQCLSDFVIIIPYLCPESLYDSVILWKAYGEGRSAAVVLL